MKCQECGAEVPIDARLCGACGAILEQPHVAATGAEATTASRAEPAAGPAAAPAVGGRTGPDLGAYAEQARTAAKEAWAVLPRLAKDPVGQLADVAAELGPQRALWIGAVYAVVFDLAVLVGTWLMMRGPMSVGGLFSMSYGGLLGLDGISGAIKLLVIGLIPPVSLVVANTVARSVVRQPGLGIGGDVFVSGVSLLPFAVFALVAGLVGMAVLELVGALFVIALCLNVLILFRGCTHVAGLSERASSLAVPVMLMLAGWLSSVLLRAVA